MRASHTCVGQGRHYVLLAPSPVSRGSKFGDYRTHDTDWGRLLAKMQRFRGAIYLKEGAIGPSELCHEQRHRLPSDAYSWHLLLMENEEIVGCMRYLKLQHPSSVPQLGVFRSQLAQCRVWGPRLASAVYARVHEALREDIGFGEAGGWALAERVRHSAEALRMVLATFSLAQLLGNALVFSTATMRNESAIILRRIGGCSLKTGDLELPSYFDPHHQCEMQVLTFDSRRPNPRYGEWVEQLRRQLSASPLVCNTQIRPQVAVA